MRPTLVFQLKQFGYGYAKWVLINSMPRSEYYWRKTKQNNVINGSKSIHTVLGIISLLYSPMNRFSKRIMTVIRSLYSDIKLRKKSLHRKIFKAKKKVQDYCRWCGDALSAISLVHLFWLMVQPMEIHIFRCWSKISYCWLTSFKKMASIILSFKKTLLLLIVKKWPWVDSKLVLNNTPLQLWNFHLILWIWIQSRIFGLSLKLSYIHNIQIQYTFKILKMLSEKNSTIGWIKYSGTLKRIF